MLKPPLCMLPMMGISSPNDMHAGPTLVLGDGALSGRMQTLPCHASGHQGMSLIRDAGDQHLSLRAESAPFILFSKHNENKMCE